MKNRLTLTALATGAALALSACAPIAHTSAPAEDEAPSTSSTPLPEDEVAAPAQDAPKDVGFTDESYAFGETITYEDGLSITIGVPETATLSEWGSADSCDVGDPIEYFEVTLVNETDATYSPVMAAGISAITTDSENGEYASPVFDELPNGESSDDMTFVNDLRPGMKASYTQAFCGTDLLVVADLSEDYDGSRGELFFVGGGDA